MKLLQPSINMGLTEQDFWNMTVAEIQRYINGAVWRMKLKAQYDYNLANMIGISNGRIMSKDVKFPSISEIYPNLFETEPNKEKELEEEKARIENSKNNFMAFALKFNAQKRNKEMKLNNG